MFRLVKSGQLFLIKQLLKLYAGRSRPMVDCSLLLFFNSVSDFQVVAKCTHTHTHSLTSNFSARIVSALVILHLERNRTPKPLLPLSLIVSGDAVFLIIENSEFPEQ